MPQFKTETSIEMDKRAEEARAFYEAVFDADERPYFVSDAATLYDIFAGDEAELVERCFRRYGVRLTEQDFRLPVWQLLDRVTKHGSRTV